MKSISVAFTLVILTFVTTSGAHAQRLETELSAVVGYGFGDLYEFGLGGGAGVLIDDVFVGAKFINNFGSTSEVRRGSQVNTTELSSFTIAAEFAYRYPAERFDFRLFADVGVARYKENLTETPDVGEPMQSQRSATELMGAPGASFVVPLRVIKLGLDVMYIFSGSPEFAETVSTSAFMTYVRVIIPIEG